MLFVIVALLLTVSDYQIASVCPTGDLSYRDKLSLGRPRCARSIMCVVARK